MNKTKQSVWQNLAAIGKSILAHVSISYDGAKGSLHIDIIPANPAEVIADCSQASIEQSAEIKALPDGVEAGAEDNGNSSSSGSPDAENADSTEDMSAGGEDSASFCDPEGEAS